MDAGRRRGVASCVRQEPRICSQCSASITERVCFRSRTSTRRRRAASPADGEVRSRSSILAPHGRTSAGRRSDSARWRRFSARSAGCVRSCSGGPATRSCAAAVVRASNGAATRGASDGDRRSPRALARGHAVSLRRYRAASSCCGGRHAGGRPSSARPIPIGMDPGPRMTSSCRGYGSCGCHYKRQCRDRDWCLDGRHRRRSDGGDPTSPRVERLEVAAAMSELARRVARYRVRLGFPSPSSRCGWRSRPTRSLAAGAIGRPRRRRAPHLGGGAPREGARGHGIRALPLHAASALSWFDHHRRSDSRSRRRVIAAAVLVLGYLAITLTAAMREEEAPPDARNSAPPIPRIEKARAPAGRDASA